MITKILDANNIGALLLAYNFSVWMFQKLYGVSKETAHKLTVTLIPLITVTEYLLIVKFC